MIIKNSVILARAEKSKQGEEIYLIIIWLPNSFEIVIRRVQKVRYFFLSYYAFKKVFAVVYYFRII